MTTLSYVHTVRQVRNPHWHEGLDPALRFTLGYESALDRFDTKNGYTIEDLGVKVRITGKNGSVLVPWTAISYAEEVTEPVTPQPETTDTVAASPRAKRGGK